MLSSYLSISGFELHELKYEIILHFAFRDRHFTLVDKECHFIDATSSVVATLLLPIFSTIPSIFIASRRADYAIE